MICTAVLVNSYIVTADARMDEPLTERISARNVRQDKTTARIFLRILLLLLAARCMEPSPMRRECELSALQQSLHRSTAKIALCNAFSRPFPRHPAREIPCILPGSGAET